jgi:hypothetical protein
MKRQAILAGIKATHWSWWVLWLGSMTLLGLTVLWHQKNGLSELAEQFRSGHYLLPIEFCMIKGMVGAGVGAASMSFFFAFAAMIDPKAASLCKSLSVGVIMLYFAYHTMAFMTFSHIYMRGYLREHKVFEGPTVPRGAVPPK